VSRRETEIERLRKAFDTLAHFYVLQNETSSSIVDSNAGGAARCSAMVENPRTAIDNMNGKTDLEGCRPTWAEIDLDALAANFRAVREQVGAGVGMMAVVKADAYGHGAAWCARRLSAAGAEWFGVALPEEGVELRRVGIEEPILCLEGFWNGQAELCLRERLTPVVYRRDVAAAFDAAARAAGVVADVHVKIDTGMNRLGVRDEDAAEFAAVMREFQSLRVDGLMTHFAAADDAARSSFTEEQLARFQAAQSAFQSHGHQPRFTHLANSATVFAYPAAHGNLVRPGGVLYGLWRDVLQPSSETFFLHPVMSLRSRISHLKIVQTGETLGYGCAFAATRPTRVATLPIGYHDGYPRALSNRGRVIVRGQFASIVGRVSMDLTLVDVTGIHGVEAGDVATLIGTDGDQSISAEELAELAGTISYEITCGVSRRVPRISPKSNVQCPKSKDQCF